MGSNSAPAPNPLCPLCGAPNECSPAACGSFDQPCWCVGQTFPHDLLARVPAASLGRDCICASCLRSAQAAAQAAVQATQATQGSQCGPAARPEATTEEPAR